MIYVCEFTQKDWQEELTRASLLAGLLDVSESERIWQKNDRAIQHQREHLSAWLLFLYALQKEYGITELSSLRIAKEQHGKPYSTARPELFFNLSHCRSACACVLSDRPVGIDVERKLSYKKALMHWICTEEEQAIFASCRNDAERAELLSVLWPMKESYVKRNGRGLSDRLDKLSCAAYLQEYRSSLRNILEPDAVQKNANQKQSTITYHLNHTMPKQADVATVPEMCVSVYEAYTLAACGCTNTELVQIAEDMLYGRQGNGR